MTRSLILSADYLDFSIRDVADGEVDRSGLSPELIEALRVWNADYQFVVRLDVEQRMGGVVPERIAELDRRGMTLAERLVLHLPKVREVRYYSEGKLTYLT